MSQSLKEAIYIDMPIEIHKTETKDGKRKIALECSNEQVDGDGDQILQSALLKSADSFLANGVIDLDHLSEARVSQRLGIKNPTDYIIGFPLEVNDIGGGRTEVVGEILKANDPRGSKAAEVAESFWSSLFLEKSPTYRASVYGFATKIEDSDPNVPRYKVVEFDWKSLAVTRRPVNKSITGYARIVKADTYLEELIKENPIPMYEPGMGYAPRNTADLIGDFEVHMKHNCPFTKKGMNRLAFQDHYEHCHGCSKGHAELLSAALMHTLRRKRERRIK